MSGKASAEADYLKSLGAVEVEQSKKLTDKRSTKRISITKKIFTFWQEKTLRKSLFLVSFWCLCSFYLQVYRREIHKKASKVIEIAHLMFLSLYILFTQVLDRSEFEVDPKPLGRERFAGCVDSCGGKVLANVLSMVKVMTCPTLSIFTYYPSWLVRVTEI